MLIRVSLIVAILAGLAVGVLNFVMVKEKIITLHDNWQSELALHNKFEKQYTDTKRDLDKTTAKLEQTTAELEATTAAKEKAEAELAAQNKRVDQLTEDLNKTREERDNAQAELAAYKATGRTPQQILGMDREYKKLQDTLEGMQAENKLLGKKLKQVTTALERFIDPNKPVYLRADLKGKVLVADPKWNFVVLDVGEDQGVLEYGELLVNRNGRLVAKIVVRSVQKDRCIANVMPGWELGPVMEGDVVIPAHPAS
jgi:exonuclease VII small subunit